VLRPGGIVVAAAISRFASLLDGLISGWLGDPEFDAIVERDLAEGQHRNPTNRPEWFKPPSFITRMSCARRSRRSGCRWRPPRDRGPRLVAVGPVGRPVGSGEHPARGARHRAGADAAGRQRPPPDHGANAHWLIGRRRLRRRIDDASECRFPPKATSLGLRRAPRTMASSIVAPSRCTMWTLAVSLHGIIHSARRRLGQRRLPSGGSTSGHSIGSRKQVLDSTRALVHAGHDVHAQVEGGNGKRQVRRRRDELAKRAALKEAVEHLCDEVDPHASEQRSPAVDRDPKRCLRPPSLSA
jgi:hypothetical protein